MAPKTTIEKLSSTSPDVTVFKITGTLGFHEKTVLERLLNECSRRGLARVLFEVSDLESLGGGCARIIREESIRGRLAIGLVGASKTVLKFLAKDDAPQIVVAGSVEEAASAVLAQELTEPATPAAELESDDALLSKESLDEILELSDAPAEEEELADAPAETPPDATAAPETKDETGSNTRDLQKRIVQYNTLFSINSDLHRFQDSKSLLDAFLLTTIAQVGVESAIFLERNRGYFVPAAVKGIEPGELRGFAVTAEQLHLQKWGGKLDVLSVEKTALGDDVKAPLLALGCTYIAPFIVQGEARGIVLLGRPIKNALDAGTVDFLKLMINQTAIAYGSLARFERENERTLGIVQTLIALIEENTLARGNTNLITSYSHAVALRMHYPPEHLRDLVYGVVLRDIGMIKVSDLIVRSPRELMPEEWEIIKRHPTDGAKMLRDMKFSDHAISVVQHHHERFNGEGYPNGVQGQDIPLGARIVSVVESYAAMLQERPTRPALTREEAMNTLKENWGMRYDAEVVRSFVGILEEEIRTGADHQDRKFAIFSL